MPVGALFLAVIQWALAASGVVALSLHLWNFMRCGNKALDLAVLLFFLVFNCTLMVFALGLAHALFATAAAILGGAILIVEIHYAKDQIKKALHALGEVFDVLSAAISRHRFFSFCVGMAVLLVAVRMMAHVWFLSPYIWDAMSYHLPKVADWVQSHSLYMGETPVTRSYWPANFEVFQTWFVLFLHHDCLIELAGLPFFVIGVLSVYALCRSCQAGRKVSIVMALSYGLTPAYYLNAVSCKNDIAITALYLMMAAVLMDFKVSGTGFHKRFWLLGMAFMWGVGVKATIVFLLPGLVVLALFCGFRYKGRLGEDAMIGSRMMLFIISASCLLGAYWYLRNMAQFNNPFYPADFRIFGRIVTGTGHGGGQQGSFSICSMVENLKSLSTFKIFDPSLSYNPDLENMAGWGWFVFAVGLPFSVVALFMSKNFTVLWVSFVVSLLCLAAFVTPDPWNTRFMTWFPALFAVATACCLGRIRQIPIREGLYGLVVIGGSLNYVGTISSGYMSIQEWRNMICTPVWSRSMRPANLITLGEKVPAKEILGYISHSNGRIYQLYHPDYSRRIRYMSPGNGAISAKMRDSGVRYLLAFDMDGDWKSICAAEVKSGQLMDMGEGLYRLADNGREPHE
jgi:hypothetical protein